jgi:hypothetical protein
MLFPYVTRHHCPLTVLPRGMSVALSGITASGACVTEGSTRRYSELFAMSMQALAVTTFVVVASAPCGAGVGVDGIIARVTLEDAVAPCASVAGGTLADAGDDADVETTLPAALTSGNGCVEHESFSVTKLVLTHPCTLVPLSELITLSHLPSELRPTTLSSAPPITRPIA